MIDQGLLEEPTPATVSPFAAVAAEYARHAAKVANRIKPEPNSHDSNRAKAAFYYKQWATDLVTR